VTTVDVADVLSRYNPRSMTARQRSAAWPMVASVVAASKPTTEDGALGAASSLCAFLASSTAWDGSSTPNASVVLTREAVDAYVERSNVTGKARLVLRSKLRRLADAAAGRSPVVRAPVAISPRTKAYFRSVALLEVPVTAVAAAHHVPGFGGLREHRWPELVTRSADPTTLVPGGGVGENTVGTVAGARAAVAALSRVALRAVAEAQMSTSRRTTSAVSRKGSRAAAMRAAEAAYTASQRPDRPEASAAVAAAVEAYRPHRTSEQDWLRVRDVTRQLTLAYGPPNSGRAVPAAAGTLMRFASWVASRPTRPDPSAALTLEEVTGTVCWMSICGRCWPTSRTGPGRRTGS